MGPWIAVECRHATIRLMQYQVSCSVQSSADWSAAGVVCRQTQANGDCSDTLVSAVALHTCRSIKYHASCPSGLMRDRTKLPHHVVPAEAGRGQGAFPISEMLIQIVGLCWKHFLNQEAGWVTGRQA